MTLLSDYVHLLRVWESNYGISAGWTLEKDGEVIALLTDPQDVEMFWISYVVTPLTQDPKTRINLFEWQFWNTLEENGFNVFNREFRDMRPLTFPMVSQAFEENRMSMRGLYFGVRQPNALDSVILWLRKVTRRNKKYPGD